MDNLTHGLLSLTIGLVRKRDSAPDRPKTDTDRAVLWACLLAGEIPDIDVFFGRGSMAKLAFHRGWTHSLLLAPAVALVATGLVKLIWRKARVGTVFVWSLFAVLIGHLLNDLMTGWGTRLLLPWSQAHLAWDWVAIVDPLYTLPLLAGVIWAWRRPKQYRKAAAVTLAYLAIYAGGLRGTSHTMVERAVASAYAGRPVVQSRVSAGFNPAAWTFTVDLGDHYEQGDAYSFGKVVASRSIPKHPEDAVTRAVKTAPELAPFFAQFPFYVIDYTPSAHGYDVTLGDVRYGAAGGHMSYHVQMDPSLRVTGVSGGF